MRKILGFTDKKLTRLKTEVSNVRLPFLKRAAHQKKITQQKVKELLQLKLQTKTFTGETKAFINNHNDYVDKSVEKLIDTPFSKREKLLNEVLDRVKKQVDTHHTMRFQVHEAKEKAKRLLQTATSFIEHTNFYPPQIAFDTNKLNGYVKQTNTDMKTDPLSYMKEVQGVMKELEEAIRSFQEIHAVLVRKIENGELSNEEKHEAFLALHKGEFAYFKDMIDTHEK